VKYFVLDKLKSWNNNTCNYLVINPESILLDILAFQCTIESLVMQTGGRGEVGEKAKGKANGCVQHGFKGGP